MPLPSSALASPETMNIRAHHAMTSLPVLGDIAPAQAASNLLEDLKRQRGDYMLGPIAEPSFDNDEAYAYDVIGETRDEGIAYMLRYGAALRKFAALGDTAPVALVINEKDLICGACVFGRHCSESTDSDKYAARILEDITNSVEHGRLDPNPHRDSDEPFYTTAGELRRSVDFIQRIREKRASFTVRGYVADLRSSQMRYSNALLEEERYKLVPRLRES